MQTDFVFIVTYECPRCHAALEDRSSGAPLWLRCPECGRACLTPEHDKRPAAGRAEPEELFMISDDEPGRDAALAYRPRPMAARPLAVPSRFLTTRRMLGGGFFLTTVLFLFGLLDGNGARAALFGVMALVFLFLLSRPIAPNIRG